MKLHPTLAWALGPLLATAAALPTSSSASPRSQEVGQAEGQEEGTEKLVDLLLQEIGYVDSTVEENEAGFPPEDPQKEKEVEEEEVIGGVTWSFSEQDAEDGLEFELRSQRRLLIGIYSQEPTELLAYHLGLPQEQAVVITNTIDDYPANRAGLRKHDVIVGVEGSNGATLDLLRQALDKKAPGESLNLTVVQRGVRKELSIPLFLPQVEGKSSEAIERSFGLDLEETTEERNVAEEEYARQVARVRDVERELRNRAMRAELDAKRDALRAQMDALRAESDMLAQEVALKSSATKQKLLERKQRLQDEYLKLEAAKAGMEYQLMNLEKSAGEARRRYGDVSKNLRRRSREKGGVVGAWIGERDGDGGDERGGSIIFFGEDDQFGWEDHDEDEGGAHFGEEVLERMEGFEDRLERIEDLLMKLIERNR